MIDIIIIFIYFLPSIIGYKHKNILSIIMLNIFLGWTFIGWVVSLVWACTDNDRK